MDDKNVVKKRVTLAIAFAVFIVVVIAVILLIKPVMSKVQENRTAKVSQETAQEAEEFLKTKYPEVVIEKRDIIYMSDSGKSPYYTVKDSTDKDNAKWQMTIVQNKSGNAKTWDYAFKEK